SLPAALKQGAVLLDHGHRVGQNVAGDRGTEPSVEENLAAGRGIESSGQLGDCGLSRAAASYQGDAAPGLQRETEIFDQRRRQRTVSKRNVAKLESSAQPRLRPLPRPPRLRVHRRV